MNDISPVRIGAEDLGAALRSTGLLASVQISVWEGMKLDRKALEELKKLHGATGDVGRLNINLLNGNDGPLKDTHSAFFAVRSRFYELTLPWTSDPHAQRQRGPRFLSNLLFDQTVRELSALKNAARDQLEGVFIPAYPTLAANAQSTLGTLARRFTYPTADEIRKLFRVHFDFEPVPARSGFSGLAEHTLGQLGNLLDKKQQTQIAEATKAGWKVAREKIEALIEATKKPNDATVANVRALLTLLPGWNITGNPVVAEICGEIDTMLKGVEASDLRKNEQLRSNTINEAQKIVDKMQRMGLGG